MTKPEIITGKTSSIPVKKSNPVQIKMVARRAIIEIVPYWVYVFMIFKRKELSNIVIDLRLWYRAAGRGRKVEG
jgi:hypothetical protein